MEAEYDHKFEQMKKYIPFLESMIKRLESTNSTSNPRQAQLNKIRSLRDLLLDKKKRMKMENLLKCEQVLINLYAKVEQRDSLPDNKKETTDMNKNENDLSIVRKKLQTAASKLHTGNINTLPDISRPSVSDEPCLPGSKEPALFQRRPNIPYSATTSGNFSPTPSKESDIPAKRQYTRVLLSPETSEKRWPKDDPTQKKPLFSRRSPKQSPRRQSPSYHKKERKKSKNKSKDQQKDLNITLNVPEESLDSLNTKDILSRILNCSDNDVDIATLRELRAQILGELKETGAKDDISDIILKSYKKKTEKTEKYEEVEEGELSDSESELIENIYGSLVIVDKDKSTSNGAEVTTENTETSRKIQICLVINSDKNKTLNQQKDEIKSVDDSELENLNKTSESIPLNLPVQLDDDDKLIKSSSEIDVIQSQNLNVKLSEENINNLEKDDGTAEAVKNDIPVNALLKNKDIPISKETEMPISKEIETPEVVKPNFYTSINNTEEEIHTSSPQGVKSLGTESNSDSITTSNVTNDKKNVENSNNLNNLNVEDNTRDEKSLSSHEKSSDITHVEPRKVSEIDILQALKKEILCQTSALSPEPITPQLHLPKITKVANANEIGSKKRISIENYKAKTSTPPKPVLTNENAFSFSKEDITKKQSLKLTEKECERFNFLTKIKLDSNSDDEDKSNTSLEDMYSQLAPKSPDHEDFADTGIKPPVIIPSDPIDSSTANTEADIDMRNLLPKLQTHNMISTIITAPKGNSQKNIANENNGNKNENILIDPRVNRENNMNSNIIYTGSPTRFLLNSDISRSRGNFVSSTLGFNSFHSVNSNCSSPSNINNNLNMPQGNLANLLTVGVTSNICNAATNLNRISNIGINMTPNARSFEMTPIHQTFDNDDSTKHIYTPLYQDTRDLTENQRQQRDISDRRQLSWEERNLNGNSVQSDVDYRDIRNNPLLRDPYQTGPRNERFMYDTRDLGNRLDCPTTPNTDFNRIDCPNLNPTSSPFGMMECPNTPNTSFGRIECPPTSSSSFGRIDIPMTPLPSFGRSECPSTPNHPFGRPEPYATPYVRSDLNQSFAKCQDPRLNRSSDYDNSQDGEPNYFQDRKFNPKAYDQKQNNNSDSYKRYQREKSVGRNERNKSYEQSGRSFRGSYRESSVGRSYMRDYESDRYSSRHRGSNARNYEYRHQNQHRKYDDYERRSFQRDKSTGRSGGSHDRGFSRPFIRDSSVNRSYSKENRSSVKPNIENSLTVDASVNSTSQKSNNESESRHFDARRRRASSVGRAVHSQRERFHYETLKNNDFQENDLKNIKYKRACSVGREIKENKLDFQNIKSDLRSFKLKDDYNIAKDRDQVYKQDKCNITESNKNTSSYYSRKDIDDSLNKSTSKYSPRNNSRDPRVRRENFYTNKEQNNEKYRSNSQEMKRYGIVYSNDNISKGNILGQGYGVKNYKIPKIKRPQEIKYVHENKSDDVDKVTKNTQMIEETTGDNQNVRCEQINLIPSKKHIGDDDSVLTTKIESETDHSEKSETYENTKITEKHEFNNAKLNKNINLETSELFSNDKNEDVAGINKGHTLFATNIENIDKRITRSASRNISEKCGGKIDNSIMRRTRRANKLVSYDFDSDNSRSQEDEDKTNVIIQPATSDINNITNPTLSNIILSSNENNSESQVSHDKIETLTGTNLEKPKDNHLQDILVSNFRLDELEIFSHGVSDPVTDNINDLIADLDHELDSSKTVTSNSKFTKELCLETMMENITSPENIDSKENDSSNLDQSLTAEINDCSSIDDSDSVAVMEIEGLVNTVKNPIIPEPSLNVFEEAKDKFDYEKNENNDVILTNNQITSENLNKLLCDNEIKEPDVKNHTREGIQSNEAIVSTSANDDEQESKLNYNKGVENEIIPSESAPDSTISGNDINKKKDIQTSLPDSTDEQKYEMNSDISSTHNSNETISIDLLSTSDKPAVQMEAIGNLLTLLQDKNKIKELMGLLGNQTTENEKLKKKLEKLSEIVSDDEDICNDKIIKFDNKTNNEKQNVRMEKDNDESKNNPDDTTKQNSEETKILGMNACLDEGPLPNITGEINKQMEESNDTVSKETEVSQSIILKNDNKNVDSGEIDNGGPKIIKKTNVTKRRKRKSNRATRFKRKKLTRPDIAKLRTDKSPPKKMSRELQKLQDDIKEMFMSDDILNATGIRMCRLAKLVDDNSNSKEEHSQAEDSLPTNQKPVVLLKKVNDLNSSEEFENADVKKRSVKSKQIDEDTNFEETEAMNSKTNVVVRPGPRSKTKFFQNSDSTEPHMYEIDSDSQTSILTEAKYDNKSSDSESDSLSSSKSFGSIELLAEVKKKMKRKKPSKGWSAGIIKTKNKKKKANNETTTVSIDSNCFIDKNYCFRKNQSNYTCRMCTYNGIDIVKHYKNEHPHNEIPLSRMSPAMAKEAIKESIKLNFQVLSKVSSKGYICRFCFEEFENKKPTLETFFWHVVSQHTGEYKQPCSECQNANCPFNLDIPPPPKDVKGQLLGYICEKCNYTQISLENLKTHVITRHNDEQTAVYTINLAVMSKSSLNEFLDTTIQRDVGVISTDVDSPRMLRSSRSNLSFADKSDLKGETTESRKRKKAKDKESEKNSKPIKIKSKITFENDDTDEVSNILPEDTCTIKTEKEFNVASETSKSTDDVEKTCEDSEEFSTMDTNQESSETNDIFDYPHFKIKYTETGSKEYICCINGNDFHYRTSLLISLKKHVQMKHSEVWDGYCYICKVIVTPQGVYYFKDCLQHMLDAHNNLPMMGETDSGQDLPEAETSAVEKSSNDTTLTAKSFINVRPLNDLVTNNLETRMSTESAPVFPIIESVVSLGTEGEKSRSTPTNPVREDTELENKYKYEEAQTDIMLRKHRVVLEAMMSHNKLVQVFKCAGRYCSFTTDSAEDALLHASTHMRVGGEDSLKCIYCDYNSSNNAIDLITHVFNSHGCCQYVCSLCFYRAVACQLVDVHINRVHKGSSYKPILYTAIQSAPIKDNDILTRDAAVRFFVCQVGLKDAACKFRTYLPGKFLEHLNLRHSSDTEFPCFICSEVASTSSDLFNHVKIHGLKLYQCAWCVYGADDESGLLAHSSSDHPDKMPKAYLRIITNKEGTRELRVLPLAHFNKYENVYTSIAPVSSKEDPVREAERSIELQKLLGQATIAIEKSVIIDNKSEQDSELDTNSQESLKDKGIDITPLKVQETLQHQVEDERPLEKQQISCIKTEKEESSSTLSQSVAEIVCLDSEEEAESHSLSKLELFMNSLEQLIQVKSVQSGVLYECTNCYITMKYRTPFRKHIVSCFRDVVQLITCAHCPVKLKRHDIANHYTLFHLKNLTPRKPSTTSTETNTLASVESSAKKNTAKPTKRKRSVGSKEKCIETPEKMKRFGPQEIDLLPINPILDDFVFCSLCEFSTKVRHNMVRHLQLHAQQQPVAQTAPVNPVPHLETNEKHFDKMLNLASSSITTRIDRNKVENNVSLPIVSAEAASTYPKYIPEKHRLTCGAKGCSYISVDESMLKCHWETLHAGTSVFHCVHCPPYQHLDTTKPLTASRVVAHLKMHDSNLYACSMCPYYHYRRQILENHLADSHKSGQVLIVREEGIVIPASPTQPQTAAPTMDLKPWQCGLCKFKSLLRLNVVDHCAKTHNSKMQYKCAYCAFRTSYSENITKHQSKSHTGKPEEIFYYYYQEGTVSDGPEGIPLWKKQSEGLGNVESKIKSEVSSACPSPNESRTDSPVVPLVNQEIDLNLVKKEVLEVPEETVEDLCKEFGEFCDPNGLKYKCSLCKIVIEDSKEAMQSHLYEELQYRKWGCSICSYKAFHKEGLNEHMDIEHRQSREPVALEENSRIETWIAKLLEYQTEIIQQNIVNLAKQKEEIFRPVPGTAPPVDKIKNVPEPSASSSGTKKMPVCELKKIFGSFGSAVDRSFCCPKCGSLFPEEEAMQDHLESELNKIRWVCSHCCVTFQTYHEAQFHCRSTHSGFSRPIEVIRDNAVRLSWIEGVLAAQKLTIVNEIEKSMDQVNSPQCLQPENSLLVVRYEEKVPTPEEQMLLRKSPTEDSDDEQNKLVIDEMPDTKKKNTKCPHCEYYTTHARLLREHIIRHYGLKPYFCTLCNMDMTRRALQQHHKACHPTIPFVPKATEKPIESPAQYLKKKLLLENVKVICYVCRNMFTEAESRQHTHNNQVPLFGKRNDVVVKCSKCSQIFSNSVSYLDHNNKVHPNTPTNYVLTKLTPNSSTSKEVVHACGNCDQKFTYLRDIKVHLKTHHQANPVFTTVAKYARQDVAEEESLKRKADDIAILPPAKRVAKKSTTKLPNSKMCARKSTAKLPFNVPCETEEFSYYGTRPSSENLENVTAMMSFCNTVVPFTLKKISEIININPVVLVKKIN